MAAGGCGHRLHPLPHRRGFDRLVDWVSETEGAFRDDLLGELPVADLLILPISDMADHWRS